MSPAEVTNRFAALRWSELVIRPAALERADGVHRLHLAHQPQPRSSVQHLPRLLDAPATNNGLSRLAPAPSPNNPLPSCLARVLDYALRLCAKPTARVSPHIGRISTRICARWRR